MDYKPEALQRKIIVELENAMFHSLTSVELAQQLNATQQQVRRAAAVLRENNVISELRTSDRGCPFRYFLLHTPVQQEISMEPAPVEPPAAPDAPAPWWRRVVGWLK
jgi:transcription initiation factor IIE alpha subunit